MAIESTEDILRSLQAWTKGRDQVEISSRLVSLNDEAIPPEWRFSVQFISGLAIGDEFVVSIKYRNAVPIGTDGWNRIRPTYYIDNMRMNVNASPHVRILDAAGSVWQHSEIISISNDSVSARLSDPIPAGLSAYIWVRCQAISNLEIDIADDVKIDSPVELLLTNTAVVRDSHLAFRGSGQGKAVGNVVPDPE